ncbi:LysR family transcriptional regulator [Nostoc sp. CHAB 5714]|uniref:LysR family transcriptional regulator n=1 Tax=Nostoc favosum CHAB5714 TaxID=2780399 RepID=A0ABS8IL62_9NOSO|nr:LysR family transcriptional regulator [Nostoc favosum CHAB5714]
MVTGQIDLERSAPMVRSKAPPFRRRPSLERLAWDNLRLLLAVADSGSFRAAAIAAGIALNTLRSKVDRLEAQFGTPLLVRSVEGVRLTQEGHELVAIARQMQAVGNSANRVQRPAGDRAATRVRITVTEGLGTYWLVPRLIELRARVPELAIDLHCDMAPPGVLFRDTDIAIQLVRPPGPGLFSERVASLHVMPFASEAYLARRGVPTSLADAAQHEFVLQEAEQVAAAPLSFLPADTPSAVALRTNTSSAHYLAVLQGAGIGFLPTYARALSRSPQPIDIGARIQRDVFLVRHPDAVRSPAVKETLVWLKAAFDGTRYPWFADRFMHPDEFESRLLPEDRERFPGFCTP